MAMAVLRFYVGMLNSTTDASREGWRLLLAHSGDSASWQASLHETARAALLMMIGNLWRRMAHCFWHWPWPLLALVDPAASHEQREHACR
eukprot:15446952-Alexandrium_andersonii.AAC.1